MKILHYSLGFPPYRTGGLTKYCKDLMIGQKEQGHDVALIWPGKMGVISNKSSIRENRAVNGIKNFEIINPLPVALDEGIIDIQAYTASCDKEIYISFLKKHNPNAVHIHTLMGLHKEFLVAAKELKVKTVFTTHDYYGICPKLTLFYKGHTCDDDKNCVNCVECNQTALSINKIKLLQSPLYRVLKDSKLVKALRRKHRREFFDESTGVGPQISLTERERNIRAEGYRALRKYYIEMYEMIDTIHFNSSVTQTVFNRYYKPKDGQVINIAHKDIKDHRKKKEFTGKLKITYLGPAKPFKGFDLLKTALDALWNGGKRDFELNVFSLTNKVSPYMNIHDGYKYEELEGIFDGTDLLIAPSICYETFGFTVLEALSYGVPVIISDNVGAKDLIIGNYGEIIPSNDKNALKVAIANISKEWLYNCNKEICDNMRFPTVEKRMDDIYKMYGGANEQVTKYCI